MDLFRVTKWPLSSYTGFIPASCLHLSLYQKLLLPEIEGLIGQHRSRYCLVGCWLAILSFLFQVLIFNIAAVTFLKCHLLLFTFITPTLIALPSFCYMDLLSGITLCWSLGFSHSSHWHPVSCVTTFAPGSLNIAIVTFLIDTFENLSTCYFIWGGGTQSMANL